jgi:hypothetical protein
MNYWDLACSPKYALLIILIGSQDKEVHTTNVTRVLLECNDCNIIINAKEWFFVNLQVSFFGFIHFLLDMLNINRMQLLYVVWLHIFCHAC